MNDGEVRNYAVERSRGKHVFAADLGGTHLVGGGVAEGWELFEKDMDLQIAEHAFASPAAHVPIVRAKCGDDAGLLGAARLAFDAGLIS